ncbi:MAG: stalk domain-containing protein [Armatimonadota bacterium]
MRQCSRTRPIVAGLLVLAMVLTIASLLGAAGASIRLLSPKAGAKVSGTIEVQAKVKADQQVSYVILGVDEDRPQSSNSAPYSFEIDTRELSDGAHRIFVEAYDRYGLVGSSNVVTVYVKNASSSAVQVKKPAQTQLAARPSAKAPTATASAAPAGPGRSVATVESISRAQVASAPATTYGTAAVSPMVMARGPMTAPTVSAAETVIGVSRPEEPASQAGMAIASGPMGSTPPAESEATDTVRAHTVVVNGQAVQFDVSPRIVNGRVLAGFRSMFESQGAKVTWNPETRTAKAVNGALVVEVPIGERIAKVSGADVDMGADASIVEGRTIVPVRFFADSVSAGVSWDSHTRTALVQMTGRQIAVRAALE